MWRVSDAETKLFACFPAFLSIAGVGSKAILEAFAEFHRICGVIGQSDTISCVTGARFLFAP
jgi:hypothetical protein